MIPALALMGWFTFMMSAEAAKQAREAKEAAEAVKEQSTGTSGCEAIVPMMVTSECDGESKCAIRCAAGTAARCRNARRVNIGPSFSPKWVCDPAKCWCEDSKGKP